MTVNRARAEGLLSEELLCQPRPTPPDTRTTRVYRTLFVRETFNGAPRYVEASDNDVLQHPFVQEIVAAGRRMNAELTALHAQLDIIAGTPPEEIPHATETPAAGPGRDGS